MNIDISIITPKLAINQIDPKQVEAVIGEIDNLATCIVVDEHNNLLVGHHIYYVAKQLGLSTLPVVIKYGLSEEDKQLLWDREWVETVEDVMFPSDNIYGIPTLDIKLQGDSIALPCLKWGSVSRKSKAVYRTIHFYTDDYKFEALWRKPETVVNMRPRCVVEPNFSTGEYMPLALVLAATFQKRWMSRFWQSCGVRVFVDLNVQPSLYETNLLGVPKGWASYATRFVNTLPDGAKAGIEWVERDYELAVKHADGKNPLFAVFGGRSNIEEVAAKRGWLWIPEDSAIKRNEYG